MTDTTITGMPGGAASAFSGTEKFPLDQAGTSKYGTPAQMKTYIGALPLTVDDGSTSVAAVTEIKFTAGATVTSGGAGIADVAVGGGGALTVTDGSTSVASVTTLLFAGATVTTPSANHATATIAGGGGGGGANVTPDTHPASPTVRDEEGEGTSLDAKWTWLAQGSSAIAFKYGKLILTARIDGASGPTSGPRNFSGIHQALASSTAFKIRGKFYQGLAVAPSDAGMYLRESSTGKITSWGCFINGTTLETAIIAWTNETTISGISHMGIAVPYRYGIPATQLTEEMYWEIELASGTLHYRLSFIGDVFGDFYTEAVTAPFTTAPDQFGLYGESYNQTSPATLVCDWIRDLT